MHITIQLLIAGVTVGSAYALAALGLVVVYKGSGVLNFAHGAIGMFGTYVYALVERDGYGKPLALVAGLATSAAIGVATYLIIIRPLRAASMLSKVMATLGLMLFLQSLAVVVFGTDNSVAPSPLPIHFYTVGGYLVSEGGLILLGIAVATVVILELYYRYSVMGLATEAASLNEPSAMRLGYRVNVLASFNWGIGSALAALAGILLVGSTGLSQETLTNVVIYSMGAAVLGGFRSLWLTLVAAEAIGLISSRLVNLSTPGLSNVLPFALVFIALLWRSDVLPTRTSLETGVRLPAVLAAKIRPVPIVGSVAIVIVLGFMLDEFWQLTVAQAFGMGVIGLSFVLITGYVGQTSLAQWVFAGIGCLYGISLDKDHNWPILAVLVVSAAVGFGAGLVVGVSAIRIRGIALAVVTLVAANAIQGLWFIPVYDLSPVFAPPPDIFGYQLTARGVYFFDAVVLGLAVVAVWLVRRARVGRRMLAVRASERSAAASGFNVTGTKLMTFGAAAALASVGGVLYGYALGTATGDTFTGFQSILLLVLVYENGVGSLVGGISVVAATLGPAVLSQLDINQNYFGAVVGLFVILNLIYFPDGIVVESVVRRERRQSRRKARRLAKKLEESAEAGLSTIDSRPESVSAGVADHALGRGSGPTARGSQAEPVLVIDDVSVVYGSVEAVSHVSLDLRPGEVVGLIGPNGAGKTSLIDAVFGMASARTGRVVLDGRSLKRMPPHRRARIGLRRTFQGAELFDDLTVWDNVAVSAASPERAEEVMARLGVDEFRDVLARDIPAGMRRRVDLGRALAANPRVVLLDEPGAGLSAQDKMAMAAQLNELATSEDVAFLLVDHDVDFVSAACHRTYALALGKLIASGETSSVLQSAPVVESYLGLAVVPV